MTNHLLGELARAGLGQLAIPHMDIQIRVNDHTVTHANILNHDIEDQILNVFHRGGRRHFLQSELLAGVRGGPERLGG